MGKYASETSVSSEMSRIEIEKTLIRYGAAEFAYAMSGDRAMIGFSMDGRQVRFMLPLPSINSREFTHSPERGLQRSVDAQRKAWEQACRQRWRALNLVIKAKLEAVECGISIFEEEFMANIVLPGNMTVGEFMLPQIKSAYEHGALPSMLPMLEGGKTYE